MWWGLQLLAEALPGDPRRQAGASLLGSGQLCPQGGRKDAKLPGAQCGSQPGFNFQGGLVWGKYPTPSFSPSREGRHPWCSVVSPALCVTAYANKTSAWASSFQGAAKGTSRLFFFPFSVVLGTECTGSTSANWGQEESSRTTCFSSVGLPSSLQLPFPRRVKKLLQPGSGQTGLRGCSVPGV